MLSRGVVTCGLLLSLSSTAGAGSADHEPDDLAGPPPEIFAAAATTRLELPALPSFELPASEPGFVGPRELRLRGRRYLGTQVQVKGYVTWIYDCVAALSAKTPRAKRAVIQRSIDDDPTQCERPKLTLGDAKATPRRESISVVEVPRPPTKLERRRLPPAELAAWPAVPKIAVGDYVVVTGQWTTKAPRGDADPAGLLVYRGLTAATAPAAEPLPTTAAAAHAAEEDAPPFVITEAPPRKVVPIKVRAESITQLGDCNRASASRDFDSAIRSCRAATATWEGNHLAWYTLASAHMAKGQWPEARATVTRAVTLRPDLAMYQLYHGVAIYEEEQQARKAGLGTSSNEAAGVSAVDASTAALVAARDAFRRAIRINPALWRAHFYLARTYQDLDDSRRAAEQLVATIKAYPSYRFAYVTLIELLRRWGHLDAALAYAQLGTRQVSGDEAAELWLLVGTLSEERGADAQALEAFSKALALRPGDGRAHLQRGQALFRTGDVGAAKLDLQAALQSDEPHMVTLRPFISELLAKIERGAASGKPGKPGKKR